MPHCPTCGRHLMRTHRSPVQKLVYTDLFRCTNCGYRVSWLRPIWRPRFRFIFSRYTHCIECGTDVVHRLTKRDRVDSVSRSFMSRILHLSGAPLNRCVACRLQYYDWRPTRPVAGEPD